MKILYICQHDPFATTSGGGMASHAYLRAFSDIADGHLDLICADIVKDTHVSFDPKIHTKEIFFVPERSRLAKYLSIFTGHLNRYIPYVRRYLKNNHSKYSTVVFDHSSIAGPLVELANSYGLRTITIHHNYEKDYYSDNYSKIAKLCFLHHVVSWEKKAFINSNLNLFLTEQDKKVFYKNYGYPIGKSFVIGVFEYGDLKIVKIPESPIKITNIQLVITGSLCTSQGVDGIVYFFKELYPKIPQNINIVIAGRNPKSIVEQLCASHENVNLIPNPDDMEKVIQNGNIYICPTRVGGGLKLRLMDGLKLGLPVITHKCSARGYDIFKDSPFFKVYSTPDEFSKCLDELISMYLNGQVTKKSVQDTYISTFTYNKGLERLKLII